MPNTTSETAGIDLDDLLTDGAVTGWWLYELPDGRLVRVDPGRRALRWDVDIQDGPQLTYLTTEQVEALLRRLAAHH